MQRYGLRATQFLGRRAFQRDHLPSADRQRRWLSSPPELDTKIDNVAVLGGGITGLASAYYLSQAFPKAAITLFEAGPRLGGWLRSEKVDFDGGHAIFEQGPRTLRPTGPSAEVVLDLIVRLGLLDEVIITPKSSPAAQNRFIYYPNHLVKLPGPGQSVWQMLQTVMTEPLFKGVPSALLGEAFRPRRVSMDDESVASFLGRRFSPQVADIASAVFHGIYAGDIEQLSASALIPAIVSQEERYGSILIANTQQSPWAGSGRTQWKRRSDVATSLVFARDRLFYNAEERRALSEISKSSVFTFRGGLEKLASTLIRELDAAHNVNLVTNSPVNKIELIRLGKSPSGFQTGIRVNGAKTYSQVISALSGKNLNSATGGKVPTLAEHPSVTVMVVNLFYAQPGLLPVRGFGYLLPRSLPLDENPERALGVVFDSEASATLDSVHGTKLTVMLGGHWWDEYGGAYPDTSEGTRMARAVVARHLGIRKEPAAVRVSLQRDCIPQYMVGHPQRMRAGREAILAHYDGRLFAAGAAFNGVSVNDCIRNAWHIVQGLKEIAPAWTGLEKWTCGDEVEPMDQQQIQEYQRQLSQT